jgi:hypothetical protein
MSLVGVSVCQKVHELNYGAVDSLVPYIHVKKPPRRCIICNCHQGGGHLSYSSSLISRIGREASHFR